MRAMDCLKSIPFSAKGYFIMHGIGNYLIFIIIPMILGLWAQHRVKKAFGTWSQVGTSSRITGAEAAQAVMNGAGIRDVEIAQIDTMLGDHYDPSNKRLCLSPDVYSSSSVAAVGIAAHEAGHAIQHANAYGPLNLRMALVPITMYASRALPFIILGGFFFHFFGLLKLGVICYLVLVVFQLITLPVEFDASRRAKAVLGQMNIIRPGEETKGVNDVLDSAALTYVAAFVAALGNLLYLLMVLQGRDRR
jgi:Zn-dependent membrane protease YugP